MNPIEPKPTPAEAVRLRARPPAIARLSRPVILTLGGLGAVAIGAALTLALQTRPAKPVELKTAEPENRPAQAAMAQGPKTYGDAPALGPPLPGDLGRPILAAQARGQAVSPPPMGTDDAKADPAVDAHRRAIDAARTSGLFQASARVRSGSTPDADPGAPQVDLAQALNLTSANSQTPVPTGAKRDFADPANAQPTLSAYSPSPPAGKLILQAQTVITAALITAVNSDLPGPVAAQVTRNVYDSLTGRSVLIPQGARLIGVYESQVAFGQRRVRLAWDRVIFPDGRSLQLDRLVGADAAGRSGLSDRVEAHWGAMAKAALLSTVLGVGAELGSDDDGDLARAIRQGVQDTVSQTGQQVVRRQLDVQPTLTLRAGLPLTILVTRDIVFDQAARGGR